MQEDLRNETAVSVENLFLAGQESYEEAQRRSAEENKTFQKTEFFRMEKLGTYKLRLLPIAPDQTGKVDRKSYEYPTRSLLLELINPKTKNDTKPSSVYVSVNRAIDAGYSVDLIDIYRKEAVDEALSRGNEKMADKIGGGSFGGGLKYNYSHATYIIDLKERAKGVQLLNLSHAQFKALEEKRFDLWQKLLQKNPQTPCPISSVHDGYVVEIKKKKSGSKTEYDINIDLVEGTIPITIEELNALMAAPRIPEIIGRYSRYHYEATLEYLRQCDERFEMNILDTEVMKEAIEQLGSELPAEDKSSFTFDKRTKDAKDNAVELSLDDLFARFEELQAAGVSDKSEEGAEFKVMMRTFIEQEKLSVKASRHISNSELLDMINDAYSDNQTEESVDEETGEVTERRRR